MTLNRRAVLVAAGAALCLPRRATATELGRFHRQGTASGPDHGDWTALIRTYVREAPDGINRVAFRSLKAQGRDALGAYVAMLGAANPAGMAPADQYAYWINLYNAVTLAVVADHYPVRSIRDIRLGGGGLFGGGPWAAPLVEVAGVPLSLDDIEHGILRPVFDDPRIHYAVNCASIGCPNLRMEAYAARRLEAMLDAGAADYINHPRGVDVRERGVTASKIYDWYKADFGGTAGLVPHWRRHAGGALTRQLAAGPRIRRYVYDWGLNDAG